MANDTQDPKFEGAAGGANAVQQAGNGQDLTPKQQEDATSWFLSESPEEGGSAVLPVNVAEIGAKPHWVDFVIAVVDRERIKDIREQCTITKPDGTKEIDEMEANLRIVVDGLLQPDMKDPKMLKVRGATFMDPGDALKARFAHKSGLIDQISGRIVDGSGYDSDDVKEIRAAGN